MLKHTPAIIELMFTASHSKVYIESTCCIALQMALTELSKKQVAAEAAHISQAQSCTTNVW